MGAEETDPEPMQLLRNVEGPPKDGEEAPDGSTRKKVVVVGLGMVGIAFIEKLMKLDAKRREYDILVFGEEPFLAYNRVGLTSYFQHRKAEELYLNAEEWYENMPENSLRYYRNTRITEIDKVQNLVKTDKGNTVPYDVLVLATGSDAILPKRTPGHDAKGVFVYRTIDDIQRLIEFAAARKGTNGAVVGGGLLGLEAAKAMLDLEEFGSVKLVERNRWVMSRQLDSDAGSMLVEQVRAMGLDVLLQRRVARINVDDDNSVKSITFEDGDEMECSCVCFAIGVSPRDELAKAIGLNIAEHGGVSVDNHLKTNVDNIYAIGECASWDNATFGLIAPGIEMADVLAFNLTQAEAHAKRDFKRPDVSTKLKLLGCDVASFGDYFADRDGPKYMPGRRGSRRRSIADDEPKVKALTYKDPFQQVYKKYLFTKDGQYLLGGMMIGDTSDYVRLLPLVNEQKKLEVPPGELIVGQKGDDDGSDLPDSAQICSCHNVSKGGVKDVIKDGTCTSIGDVKSCTKAGTGCGGCMPLVQTIFNQAMADMGQEVKNHLCPHFEYSRADLFNIVYVREIDNFAEIMKQVGKDPNSTGCEACKPAIGSILASLYNKNIMDTSRRGLQDTNDRFLANVQRNGTFSVIPRVSGGEITPDKLIVIGSVAKKYGLYTKITGGQRIDMFGAKKQNLLDIWQELIEGGMESGHAYAKSLRTVKSCVGTSWCRFGIGDSVGMAIRLEERYKSIRSPHKLKGGVSGCVRECAEAQSKDFGLIATDKGYNIFVGGNGGATPRHAELLAKDVPPDDVVPILDRYLAFYIRCADKLQRTARWIENLPNGINYLKEVILEDKLGICDELEKQMIDLVGSFFCEWTETLNDPTRRKAFRQFANTDEAVDGIEIVDDRGQPRPAYWAKESAYDDFRGKKWSSLTWQPIVEAEKFVDAPTGSSLPVKRGDTQLAIFKVRGKYYCSQQMCPHRRAFALSDGLLGDDGEAANSDKGNDCGKLWISCPMHKRNYLLKGEDAGKCSNDENFSVATFDVEERDDGWVYVKLPPVGELDELLGTQKWRVMANETKDPFEAMDIKLNNMKGMKGRKVGKTNGPDGTNGVQAAKAPPEEKEKADKIIAGKDSLSKDGTREPDAINGLDF